MKSTTTSSTGHLAMSQIVTAVLADPEGPTPTSSATGPVRTRATSTSATDDHRVTTSWSGRSLMNERPSSTS